MKGFLPIDGDTPRQRTPMIVVMGIDVPVQQGALRYTTDPYCVWWDDAEQKWARWPHPYPPTHWLPLDVGAQLQDEKAKAESFRLGREAADARIEALAPALQASLDALDEMIGAFERTDCEVCGGDCHSANPPVMGCPSRVLLRAKATLMSGQKELMR